MKILIIYPNLLAHRYIAAGISMISAVLKRAGHEVSFMDTSRYRSIGYGQTDHSGMSERKLKEVLQFMPVDLPKIEKEDTDLVDAIHLRIMTFGPGLICFSATSSEILFLAEIAEKIRKYNIPVIVGGAHATVCPGETLNINGVSMVCVGEGEEAIVELADSIEKGSMRTDIKNIWFKTKEDIIKNGVRPYIRDLDALPYMDLDIFDKYHHIGAYRGKVATYARVETGRGCPYRCSYCINAVLHDTVYNGEKKHIRNKTPGRVIDEILYIDRKIHFDIIRFVDETFTACSMEWLEEFVRAYKRDVNRPFIVTTRPERVTWEKMEILREASDNIQVTMGVESGSEKIRKNILNRFMSNDTIINAFRICHELGFDTAAFNMIGIPGETRGDFFETIELNKEINTSTPMLSYFYPFPGCRLREESIGKGYLEDKLHLADYSTSTFLNMPDFTPGEIEGLRRTFVMYVKMDRSYYPDIEKAEKDDVVFESLAERFNKSIGFPVGR